LLGCPWTGTPDNKSTTTSANAFYCLSIAETAIADIVNQIYERTKQECSDKDIKPSDFGSDERQEGTRSQTAGVKLAPDRELASKVADAARPMSLEEIRAMIE
jgi:hypothetical protein